MIITAPFTPEQVVNLNRWQESGVVHPFTCGSEGKHEGHVSLVATESGWVCPKCDYQQSWAHDFMAEYHAFEETKGLLG